MGYDFDRQRPVDEYIVDFFCKDLLLAVEIDGASHDHPDRTRKTYTASKAWAAASCGSPTTTYTKTRRR